MEYQYLRYEQADRIGIIQIHRPEAKNALNDQVRAELLACLEQANSDTDVRGVIITGGRDVFSGGADIKAMAKATPADMLFRQGLSRIVAFIESMPKPVIAAISGYALGGGCELALACDIRIASETAVLGQPEIRIGIIPGGGGTQRLAHLVGASKAKDMIFSGRQVKADEAYRMGLVDQVVPEEQLLEKAREKMQSYICHGAVSLAVAKQAIITGLNVDINSGDLLEKICFSLLFGTEDQKEGIQAFIEKRKANFKGQ